MPTNPQKQYVIGRGKLYFDQFVTDTQTKTGERYLGNTPAFSMAAAYTNLDHYDADAGLREKDDSVNLQTDRTGTFQCDNISMANVALMFGSSVQIESQGSSSGESESFKVYTGRYYQLGSTDDVPEGAKLASNVVVTNASGLHAYGYITFTGLQTDADTIVVNGETITFVASAPGSHEILIGATGIITAQDLIAEINAYPSLYDVTASGAEGIITLRANASGTGGNSIVLTESAANLTVSGSGTLSGGTSSSVIGETDNYTVDATNARIYILDDAADISDGDTIEVVYDLGSGARYLIVDSQSQVEGALRFVSDNARGPDKNYYYPRVKISPSGDYQLKGDAWQTMTFTFEVLKPATAGSRVYVRSNNL